MAHSENLRDLEFFIERDGCDVSTIDMPREDYARILASVRRVRAVAHIESLYHLLVTSIVEFNEILSKEADRSRFAHRNENEVSLYRLEGNRRAAGFLTTLDMYKEFVCPAKGKSMFGVERSRFESDDFRFCNGLRNYLQHIGCFPLTIRWSSEKLACSEVLRSVHDLIPMDEIDVDNVSLWPKTKSVLKELRDKQGEIDVSQIFSEAMDVVSEIHCGIRNTEFYQRTLSEDRIFLEKIEHDFCRKGYFFYRYKGDSVEMCRGHMPYLVERQIELIDYFRNTYSASNKVANTYLVALPPSVTKRLSIADECVAQYVKNNGVICQIGDCTYTSSKYQTPDMRLAYNCGLQGRKT